MKKGRLKRGMALFLSTVTLSMSVIPHLPPDILTAFAFSMNFNTSTSGDGHYDISGRVDGQREETDFLCMKKGASAKSGYDYYKTDNDVSYSDGTIEQKRLFWAYMLTYGNTPGIHPEFPDHSIENYFRMPLSGSTRTAKEVAWSHGKSNGGSDIVERMANDGFMQLESIPEGCKSPQDVFNSTSQYGTPEDAISMNALKSGPGEFDPAKLYEMAGLKDWATFQKYCKVSAPDVEVSGPGGTAKYPVKIEFNEYTFNWSIVDPNTGYPVLGLDHDPVIFKVEYDPNIFKVLNVTGRIEYFETDDAADSQPFYRAFGKVEVTYPVFYMTTGTGKPVIPPTGGGGNDGGGGGNLGGGDSISVKIYEHQETFESHYKVDLTKYDYETGYPLKDSIWQVLEAFPDKDQIGTDDETNGQLVESKMREDPTTWNNWLIFEEDMATDENGYISHADERFYDFAHKYCDGHPIPPEPESDGEEDEGSEDEYAQLMEEWQAAVDECAAVAAASNGTFHHWECGSEDEPSEEEAFEGSGCKAARDLAYENFINLRYSYTFREVDPRNGYIIHGPNGHPDDVPVEIVTIASSEAGKEAEWTECSNEDIIVEGRAENALGSGNDEEDGETESEEDEKFFMGSKREKATDSNYSGQKLYLTEKYELSWGEQIVNALRNFVGLPDKFIEENEFALNIVAEYDDIGEATPSDAEYDDEEELIDDVIKPTEEESEPETEEKPTESTTEETESQSQPTVEETEPTEGTKPEVEETEPETEEPSAAETEAPTQAETETEAETENEEDEEPSDAETEDESEKEESTPEAEEIRASITPRKVQLVSARNPLEETIADEAIIDEDIVAEDDLIIDEDMLYNDSDIATPSNATDSEASRKQRTSYDYERDGVTFSLEETDHGVLYEADGGYIDLEGAIIDSQPGVDKGPADNIGHSFKVYDHRVPGQIHFNKKDMQLAEGENADYDAYGDTQGDSTLEGAVYGLFAADDIYGPDTQMDESGNVIKGTGVIFDANDLVSVATTDKNGDGSFLTITEKPHSIYNYGHTVRFKTSPRLERYTRVVSCLIHFQYNGAE